MDPKNFIENLLINLGMGFDEQMNYYPNDATKFELCKVERTVPFRGTEIPLAKTNHNTEQFKKTVSDAKERLMEDLEGSLEETTSDGGEAIYTKVKTMVGESMNYYSKILDPSIETVQLLGNLVANSLETFGNRLFGLYDQYVAEMDNINESTYATYERVNDQISAKENREVPMVAHARSYQSPLSNMTITETKFHNDYGEEYARKETAKKEREMNAKLIQKDRNEQFAGAENRFLEELEPLVSDAVSKWIENYEKIIISKHPDYFDVQYDQYANKKYWKDAMKVLSSTEIPTLKEILEYYGFSFDAVLEDAVFEHMATHYGKTKTEYQGPDLELYLKEHNLTSLSPEEVSGLSSAMKKYYESHYGNKKELSPEDRETIKNCIYLKESDKNSLVSKIATDIEAKALEEKSIQKAESKEKRNKTIFKVLKILLIVGLVGIVLWGIMDIITTIYG